MDGAAFKRRLFHSVASAIMAYNNFLLLLKSFNAKCKACLKVNFKCVCVTFCSLVMNPFSCEYIHKNGNSLNKISAVLKCVQYLVFRWYRTLIRTCFTALLAITIIYHKTNIIYTEILQYVYLAVKLLIRILH